MVDSNTLGYLQTLGFGLAVAIILLLVFSVLRRKVPDVYEHRALLNTWQSHDDYNGKRVGVVLPRPANSFFGWLKPILFVSEEEIVRKVGLDAAMFLRYLWTCLQMVIVIALLGCLLMPVYGTGDNKNRTITVFDDVAGKNVTGPITEGLRVISLSNVPDKDARLWATVIVEYIVAAVVLYFMTIDYGKFAELRRAYRVSETPVNYALVVFDIPDEHLNEPAIRDRFELIVPGQVSEVILVKECADASKLQKKLDVAVAKRELAEYVKATKGDSPQTRPGACGFLMCHKPKVDALDYWKGEQNRLARDIKELGSTAKTCPSAIVIFSNKRAAALLAQANSATSATSWSVVRAGEPDGTHWKAFSVPGYQAEVRSVAVLAFIILFTTFWTIPATFVSALFSFSKLTSISAFEWLDFVNDWSPALTALIDSVLPAVVMSVLISLIPTLFRFVVGFERTPVTAVVERKTRDYFYFFTLYGSFFVIVLGSAILRDLKTIIDDPVEIIRALSKGIPGTGLLFATFILVQTMIPLPLQLSGVIRVIVRAILLKLAKTERQKRKARSGGSLFQYFRYSGQAMLILFLCLMYSSLNPIVPVTGLLYFLFAIVTFKYMVCFTTYSPWEGGGELYPGTYWGTMVALMLKQIIVILVLALKKGPAQAILSVIPLLATIGISLVTSRRYSAISKHGSLHDMYEDAPKMDEIPASYKNIYKQPAGHQEEYENLNGIEETKDTYEEVQYDDVSNMEGLQSEHHDADVGYVPDRAADRSEV